MLKYILKRLFGTVIVLFGASVLCFFLLVNSGNPLEELMTDTGPDAVFRIERRAEQLHLALPWTDEYFKPWYERYWIWLSGVLGCFRGACDFGQTVNGGDVTAMIANASVLSLRLVLIATVASIVLGILTGIVSAIRQYSLFDFLLSFILFLFWSLPVFWAAILGKEWLAIRFNNWMGDPHFAASNILLIAIVLSIAVPMIMGGSVQRRVITGAIMFIYTCTVMPLLDHLHFMENPRLGAAALLVLSLAIAVGMTSLIAGIQNRRVLYVALAVVVVGMIGYYATWNLIRGANSYFVLLGLFALTIAICVVLARVFGGYAKGQATVVTVITGILMSGLILLDHYMYTWPQLLSAKPRPVRTIGESTPNLQGDFWVTSLDHLTQLWIPTMAMMLVSVASYTRYTRASMLEANRQDYVRTARAKGVEERSVVLKHAFRNSLLPLITIVAFDFAGLVSGAVVVERVFGWNGMGMMFITGLQNVDPAPVMAVIVFTGFIAVVFNFIADILYAVLDPRIRV